MPKDVKEEPRTRSPSLSHHASRSLSNSRHSRDVKRESYTDDLQHIPPNRREEHRSRQPAHTRTVSPPRSYRRFNRSRSRSPQPQRQFRSRGEEGGHYKHEHEDRYRDRNRHESRDRNSDANDRSRWHDAEDKKPVVDEKVKPTMALSGKLTAETNTFRGVVIKYSEPPEAQQCPIHWRLYPFKGTEALPVLHVHRQSGYLIGRDPKICDIPMDHPSISKQHAVLQYRQVPDERGQPVVRPYIIDLDSANGSYLNGEKIQSRVYVELREKDVLRFAFSSREYVLLTEDTA